MNLKLTISILGITCFVQGCSLFNKLDCNNSQVKQAVEKLYASQVSTQPLSSIEQMQQQFNQNYNQIKVQTQSTVGINLSAIDKIDPAQLKTANNDATTQALLELMVDRFEGASYICKGTIQQNLPYSANLKKPDQDQTLIQNGKLNIPVIYAIYHEADSDEFQVQYTPQNPVQLMEAMSILHEAYAVTPQK